MMGRALQRSVDEILTSYDSTPEPSVPRAGRPNFETRSRAGDRWCDTYHKRSDQFVAIRSGTRVICKCPNEIRG